MQLPDLGLLVMQDAETGEQLFVDTHDRGFRKRSAARAWTRWSSRPRMISLMRSCALLTCASAGAS
jgi:hypothetical protein